MDSIFTISLDFELHWGGFEKWPLKIQDSRFKIQDYGEYFLNTRAVIPLMLALFEKYKVHVTWAGVGLLFHENKEELLSHFPSVQPTYKHKELSAYEYIDTIGIGDSEEDDPFHYAHTLIRQIVNTPGQELGSHTFGHFYCNEEGQTVEQFRADLKAAQLAASRYSVSLKSLVFPRNQFNDEYLKVCFEEGFTNVRSNPQDWFWNINTRHESKWKRLNRGLDAYFPVGSKNTYPLSSIPVRKGFPVCLPASRLLRPYRPQELFLNDLKIDRIHREMTEAAKRGEVYHLWWHPHNFGRYPKQSLTALEKILTHYNKLRNNHKMRSYSMKELADQLIQLN